jgi:hypothetical protein
MAKTTNELDEALRAFVTEHPRGWNHREWEGLLDRLSARGVRVSDTDAIGIALEQTRLSATLESLRVRGLGPKRREAVVGRFRRMWDLQHATVDEVAAVPSVTRKVAEDLLDALH